MCLSQRSTGTSQVTRLAESFENKLTSQVCNYSYLYDVSLLLHTDRMRRKLLAIVATCLNLVALNEPVMVPLFVCEDLRINKIPTASSVAMLIVLHNANAGCGNSTISVRV